VRAARGRKWKHHVELLHYQRRRKLVRDERRVELI
jgi:hypothetical protein